MAFMRVNVRLQPKLGGQPNRAMRSDLRSLLIDNYDSYTYNLYQLIAEVNGVEPLVMRNDDISIPQARHLIDNGLVHNVVISPGPGTPENPADIGAVLEVFRELTDVAILGVCLGHQALAAVHGARIGRAPAPVHGRLSKITHNGHALFAGIPLTGFQAVRYHSLLVEEESLPPELQPICWTEGRDVCLSLEADDVINPSKQSQNQRLLMGVSHCSRPHFGVQFHPESIATQYGEQLLSNFVRLSRTALATPAAPIRGESNRVTPSENESAMKLDAKYLSRVAAGPPLSDAQTYAENHVPAAYLQLVHRRTSLQRGITGDRIMEMLAWGGAPDTFWLDSADDIRGRFSFLGGPGGDLWLRMTYKLPDKCKHTAAKKSELAHAEATAGSLDHACTARTWHSASEPCTGQDSQYQHVQTEDSHQSSCKQCMGTARVLRADGSKSVEHCTLQSWLKRFLNQHTLSTGAALELPFDFKGGLVGFIGYEMKAESGGAIAHRNRHADAVLSFADRLVVLDHHEQQVYVLAIHDKTPHVRQSAERWVADTYAALHSQAVAASGIAERGANDAAAAQHSQAVAASGIGARGPNNAAGLHEQAQNLSFGAPPCSTAIDSADDIEAATRRHTVSNVAAASPIASSSGSVLGCGSAADARSHLGTPCSKRHGRTSGSARSEPCRVPGGAPLHCDRVLVAEGAAVLRSASDSQPNGLCLDRVRISRRHLNLSDGFNGHESKHECTADSNSSDGAPMVEGNAFRLARSRAQYLKDIDDCMEALYEGNSYEICLTNALHCEVRNWDVWDFYKVLRKVNPAPYSAWLHCGEGNPIVCCSSPELFLRLTRDGVLEARPIKGTAARDLTDARKDEAAAKNLAASEKDRAENLMIVDLLRNDLGRVCASGSVHVPSMMQVESYTSVHQLVSTVRGRKREDCSAVDAFFAAFPGGSMTGAPKIRSMEIIDRIEGAPRGVYSGGVGFFSLDGSFDFNIVIRTATFHEGHVHIGAGGAIVVQSNREDEYDEMQLKAKRLLHAFSEYCEGASVDVAEEATKDPTVSLPRRC